MNGVMDVKKFFVAIIATFLMIFSAKCYADVYEVRDMVPGESDAGNYANYTVNTEINLHDFPRSPKIVATLQTGDFVTRTSSITLSKATSHAVKILRTIQVAASPKGEFRATLNEGDFVYLLMPLSRGYLGLYNGGHVWNLSGENIRNFIKPNVENAWGEYQGEPTDINLGVEVWEFLERNDGIKGWALTWDDGVNLNQLDRRRD